MVCQLVCRTQRRPDLPGARHHVSRFTPTPRVLQFADRLEAVADTQTAPLGTATATAAQPVRTLASALRPAADAEREQVIEEDA